MNAQEQYLKAPFPWFGGKSLAAELIWKRFGKTGNYIEPFAGSLAVLLGRPKEYINGYETVNDIDGLIVNFWRSVKMSPDETAEYASNLVNECDLHARHLALVNTKSKLSKRLMGDPDYCDPKLAGWWAWGACVWIGSGWCAGKGPWVSIDGLFQDLRQLPHLGNAGRDQQRIQWLKGWFDILSDRIRCLRIACGDWKRICSIGTITKGHDLASVLLDPPYDEGVSVYSENNRVFQDCVEWCRGNGHNEKLSIALCTYTDGLDLKDWKKEYWSSRGGYQSDGGREIIYFSPHCIFEDERQQELFA